MRLLETLSQYWLNIQGTLFPWLSEELGELTDKQQQLITVLEMLRIEEHLPSQFGLPGRPPSDRVAVARAFVAKAVYDMSSTKMLLDRLVCDIVLRRICGWEKKNDIPSESTFSRAFAEFSETQLASKLHEALIVKNYQEQLVGHISRDSTEIEVREKPVKKEQEAVEKKPKRKPGRPKKGEVVIKEPTRLQRQGGMTLEEMLDDLPKSCDVGSKKNSKGHKETWIGYKLHIDTADGQVPISCVLSSASTHDSQAAIPLSQLTHQRVTNLYDLMDSAYDAQEIKNKSLELGHIPLIDPNPRRDKSLKEELDAEQKRLEFIHFKLPEQVRYFDQTAAERVNGRLKDEFGGRHVRVRGHAKVFSHLMFGILVLTVDQLIRLVT
jgi:hypothetical protein